MSARQAILGHPLPPKSAAVPFTAKPPVHAMSCSPSLARMNRAVSCSCQLSSGLRRRWRRNATSSFSIDEAASRNVSYAVYITCLKSGAERAAASAGGTGLWILEFESTGIQAFREMELGTLQVETVAFVHDILEAILFEYLVVFGHLVNFQDVAQTRAAAALHTDAHELPLRQTLGKLDATHLFDGAVGEADRGAGIVKGEDVGHS
jgi:hypothetical protein